MEQKRNNRLTRVIRALIGSDQYPEEHSSKPQEGTRQTPKIIKKIVRDAASAGVNASVYGIKKADKKKGIGSRQTQPVNMNVWGKAGYGFIPKVQYEQLDYNTLQSGGFTLQRILELLPEISPDVSMAL